MKCKKCGCDTLIKTDDWYKCANCGAVIFDTEVQLGNIKSPTKEVESIENNSAVRKSDGDSQDAKGTESEEKKEKSKLREAIDFCIPIVIAVIIAIILKTCVFANAVVPTGSMISTINEKDRIIASRLAYINHDPERYDIVIFHYPDDEKQYFVKRIIGLPGETVEVINGIVYVTKADGETIQLDDSFVTNCVPTGDYGPYVVPEDCYFMMGDNRNSSWDSRFWDNKYVHRDKIIGQVKFRYYPGFSKIQ
ncbi:MAG: signal peptidase I [Eubacterium sp.]